LERAGEDVFKYSPKVIIVDEVVPPKGGANLIARIRKTKNAYDVPIIFMVKATSKEVVAEAVFYGSATALEKPYRKSALVNILSQGVNMGVEAEWESFEPTQKAALKNTEEFATMKTHVCCTVDFLEKTPDLPKAVLVIAGQHHEKLDGSGYPHGI
jgi:response regulator RpfG family c-di-GMP phosphodiesterase